MMLSAIKKYVPYVVGLALALIIGLAYLRQVAPIERLTLPSDFVMTWYSFQDNTPCNSTATASQRGLIPYVSVALPFRYMKDKGGPLSYGDKIYVHYLDGRVMPNGSKHTGWVQIDDFCGDGGDDSYCFQRMNNTLYPNVDLYIGDFKASGMKCDHTGPAGSGQELTKVTIGTPPPPGKWVTNYGGAATGTGPCGDCVAAKKEQCLWHYTPKWESWWSSVCGKKKK